MKKVSSILLMIVVTSSIAQAANQISITGSAPKGASILMKVGYQSSKTSLFCTELSLEDWKRNPKIYDIDYPMSGSSQRFTLTAPLQIETCDANLISLPSLEITLAGTNSLSSLGYLGEALSVQGSNSDINSTQKVVCKKFQASNGLTTLCEGVVYMGPSGTINLAIEEK